ncbi:MAG: type I 3-dehydroquinate dehydratase [Verrucomicrobiae bacterium]|nr:type I 3-dehydroquinate dehydratase [Verrucomicrobiae bacterium]
MSRPDLTTLLASPRVVATVHRPEDLPPIAADSIDPATCDILEFRLDNLRDHLDEAESAMKATPFPCLITARHPAEGGTGELSAERRLEMLKRFLPLATLVDVEVQSLDEMTDVIEQANADDVGVIASAHNFEKPMTQPELESISEAVYESKADIVKVAMVLETMLDLSSLLVLTSTLTSAGSHIASMGMGPLGKISRLTLAAAGSCLNYGYLSEPNAPGQWAAAELKRLLAEILKS